MTRLGPPELTTLFGPEIAALTDDLDGSGALGQLRAFDGDERLYVSPGAGVIATVEPTATVPTSMLTEALAVWSVFQVT